MGVNVIRIVTDDVIIELAVLEYIVGIEGDVSLHVLLSPLGGHHYILPVVVAYRFVLCSEVVVVGLVLELKAVVSDTPVEGVLDVASIVSDARVESSGSMWFNPGG